MFYMKAKLAIILIFLAGYLSSCATVSTMKNKDKKIIETKIWHAEPKNRPKAVIILLHGLNLKPTKMDDWSQVLSMNGAHVMRFALYGHTGEHVHMRNVTADAWRHQFREVAASASKIAQEHGVPLYFIGFSLGALVALEWLANHDDDMRFDKMVLIAPAISVPWYSRVAIKAFSVFGRSFMLPSRSPEQYRANRGTSIAAYLALFDLKDSLEKNLYKNANVKTLVLIDKEDELVDSRGIQDAIKQFKLSAWTLEIVNNRFAYDNYGFRHLMVDQEAIGQELWSTLSQMVIKHFGLNGTNRPSPQ